MNILITGAGGFIGRRFSQALGTSSHKIYALDYQKPAAFNDKNLEDFFVVDITKEFELPISFDCVFHLAACNLTNVDPENDEAYCKVNIDGTKNLIRSTKIKHFVLMSTTLVYKQEGKCLDESSPLGPIKGYEKSKLETEKVCRQHFPEGDLTIIRSINVVGPGQAEKAVIPVFFKKACHNEPLNLIRSRKERVQLLYIDDLIEAFYLILRREKGCGIINLASEDSITIGELANRIIEMCHSESEIQWSSDEDISWAQVSSEKAQKLLGWRARISIAEILCNYYKFYSGNEI